MGIRRDAYGLFVSNLIGTSALSAINLTAPVIQVVTAISTMLATGGSAVIMKKMGEQKPKEAKEDFTFLILVNVVVGLVMTILGYSLMETIFGSMGLSPEVAGYCTSYLSPYLFFTIPTLLMNNFTLYTLALLALFPFSSVVKIILTKRQQRVIFLMSTLRYT